MVKIEVALAGPSGSQLSSSGESKVPNGDRTCMEFLPLTVIATDESDGPFIDPLHHYITHCGMSDITTKLVSLNAIMIIDKTEPCTSGTGLSFVSCDYKHSVHFV
jgi:hypothetical protein